MPKKTEHNALELDSYVEKLVDRGSKSGSVTEDEIQIVLKRYLEKIVLHFYKKALKKKEN